MRFLVAICLLVALVLGAMLTLGFEEREVDPEVVPARAAQPRPVEPQGAGPLAAGPLEPGSADSSARGESARRTIVPAMVGEEVEPGLSLTGSVRDDLGTPLFSFHVRGEPRGPELEQRQIEPDGTFTLSGFDAGEQRVEFSAPGHESVSQVLEFPLAGELEVVLRRLARISGVVVDATGAPAEDVYLTVLPPGTQAAWQISAAISDDAGRFEFEARPESFGVRVGFAGAPLREDLQFELAPGQQVTGLVVRLRSGGVIEGFVHARTGAGPAAGAPVSAVSDGFRKLSFTEAGGRFRIEGLAAGEYTVSVGSTAVERRALLGAEETSSASLASRSASAEVVEGAVTHVEIGEPGELLTRVRGRVTLNGEPLTGEPPDKGLLSASREGPASEEQSWEGTLLNLDSKGRFALLAEPGLWRFETRPLRTQARFMPSLGGLVLTRTLEIPASAEYDLDLRFETGSISGSVHTSAGDALSGVQVLLSGGDELNRVRQTVTTNTAGGYHFGAVLAGLYTLRTQEIVSSLLGGTQGPRLIDESTEEVFVSAGSETSSVDFTLRPGGGVRLDSSASQIDLAQTVLHLSRGALSIECTYIARLRQFVATGLEPGLCEVTVLSGPLELAVPVTVDVTPGTWARVVLELEPPHPR